MSIKVVKNEVKKGEEVKVKGLRPAEQKVVNIVVEIVGKEVSINTARRVLSDVFGTTKETERTDAKTGKVIKGLFQGSSLY